MRTLALCTIAATATLMLGACNNDADDEGTATTTATENNTTVVEQASPVAVPGPVVTETSVVETPAPTPRPGTTVNVGPSGVSATTRAGDTTVQTTTK